MSKNNVPKNFLDWTGLSSAPDWAKSRILGGIVCTVVVLLLLTAFVALVMVLFHTIGQASSPGGEGPNLGAGALIAALLGAPFVIWGTVLKHQTVRYQKEGHITDRINKAVEMLGAEKTVKKLKKDKSGSVEVTVPNIEVRIGAILSLERIAQDSTALDHGRDHVRVMEILCAYVRENSNARKPVDYPEPDWEPLKDGATGEERQAHLEKCRERFGQLPMTSKAWRWAQSLPEPRTDIQAALSVLGRRSAAQRRVEAAWPERPTDATVWPFDTTCPTLADRGKGKARTWEEIEGFQESLEGWKDKLEAYSGYWLDLRGSNLQRMDLTGGVFSRSNLSGARLEGAYLAGVQLKRAELSNARLEGASLWDGRQGGAHLEAALLNGARLEGAFLWEARLDGASLQNARLEGAFLSESRLDYAYLENARLEWAGLGMASLAGAYLSEARLARAYFGQGRLEGVRLLNARLEGAVFTGAIFHGAGIRCDRPSLLFLDADQANSLFADASVILPEGVDRPEHWLEWRMNQSQFLDGWRKWLASPATYTPPPPPA